MKRIYFYNTVIGQIAITETNGFLNELFFNFPQKHKFIEQESDVLHQAYLQLCQYLAGKRQVFELPLKPQGSIFQLQVWQALQEIPFGHLSSYKKVAQSINCPKAYRAVGNANGKNPIPIIIPCHRVINTNGGLGGYSSGLDIKRKLLRLEGITKYL